MSTVYVFLGEHIALVDFVSCLQRRRLLDDGEYIVISVDDEIYDPQRRHDIVQRGNLKLHQFTVQNKIVKWNVERIGFRVGFHSYHSDVPRLCEKIWNASNRYKPITYFVFVCMCIFSSCFVYTITGNFTDSDYFLNCVMLLLTSRITFPRELSLFYIQYYILYSS